MALHDGNPKEKERLGNVWLSFATAVVAGRTRPSFDDNGKAVALDTEDIEQDSIETANRMTKAFDRRFGAKVKKADLDNFEIEPAEEEEEEEEEEDEDENEEDEEEEDESSARGRRRR